MEELLSEYSAQEIRLRELMRQQEVDSKELRRSCKQKLDELKRLMETRGASTVKVDDNYYLRLKVCKSRRVLTDQMIQEAMERCISELQGSRARAVDIISESINLRRTNEYNVAKIERTTPRNPLFIKQADPRTLQIVRDVQKMEADLRDAPLKREITQVRERRDKLRPKVETAMLKGGVTSQEVTEDERNYTVNYARRRTSFLPSVAEIQKAVAGCLPPNITASELKTYFQDAGVRITFATDVMKFLRKARDDSATNEVTLKSVRKKRED